MKILRTLGLAALMTLALGAGSASASIGVYMSGKAHETLAFNAEAYPVGVSGTTTAKTEFNFFKFSSEEAEGKCATTTFEGLIEEAGPYMGGHMAYGKCTAQNGTQVTVKSSECPYVYETGEGVGIGYGFGSVSIFCQVKLPGVEFVASIFGSTLCTAVVTPQHAGTSSPGEIFYSTTGSGTGRAISVNSDLENLKYTRSGPACEEHKGTFTNGRLVTTGALVVSHP